jgi:chromosome segregation ATPase
MHYAWHKLAGGPMGSVPGSDMALYCNAVLAAFDKPEPPELAEHNDVMRGSTFTSSDAVASELVPYGTASQYRRQLQRLSRLRCAAEKRARRAKPADLPELSETERQALEMVDMTPILGTPEERLRRAMDAAVRFMRQRNKWRERAVEAEAECKRIQADRDGVANDYRRLMTFFDAKRVEVERLTEQLSDATHAAELAESALAGERQEVERLREDNRRVNDTLHGQALDIDRLAEERSNLREHAEKAEAKVNSLQAANAQWAECGAELRACLRDLGSDGSIYRGVMDEAAALLRYWRAMLDEKSADIDKLREQLADSTKAAMDERCDNDVLRQRCHLAEDECDKLREDIAFYRGELARAKTTHNDAIKLLTETETERDRLREDQATDRDQIACQARLIEQLREQLADIENATKAALDERCDADEKHCSCVPLLRAEVKRLTKALADADRDECCTAYKAQQRAEVERLRAELARAKADAETYLRIGRERGEKIATLTEVLQRLYAYHDAPGKCNAEYLEAVADAGDVLQIKDQLADLAEQCDSMAFTDEYQCEWRDRAEKAEAECNRMKASDPWKRAEYWKQNHVEANQEIDCLRAQLADIDNATKAAMDERCDAYDKHCSCVPLLRAEVKRLTNLLDRFRAEVRMYCRPGMVQYDVFPVFKEVDDLFAAQAAERSDDV